MSPFVFALAALGALVAISFAIGVVVIVVIVWQEYRHPLGDDMARTVAPVSRPHAFADYDAAFWQRVHAAEQAALDTLAQDAEMGKTT